MYTRGPMPDSMRLVILLFFGGVGFMMLAPMCAAPIMLSQTAEVMAEHAPTDADREKAAELQAYADEAGLETRVTPQHVAMARKTGELDELEQTLEGMAAGLEPGEVLIHRGREADLEPTHVSGAYYPDEPAETESGDDNLMLWAALTFGGVFAFLLAAGFAVFTMFGGDEDDGIEVGTTPDPSGPIDR